jgi:transposase
MGYVMGEDREQGTMFPERLDDYIREDNPVRFLDAFVESLDLLELGFKRAEAKQMGRPAYHPGLFVRLYLYGYLYRLRSSRKLKREAERNVELMWLLRKLMPDHKTIADFRKDNLQPLRKVCGEFSALCRKMKLFGGELVAVDGSKFKASNGRERNFNEKKLKKLMTLAEQSMEKYLAELNAEDAEEAKTETTPANAEELKKKIEALGKRKAEHQRRLEELQKSGESEMSLTDPEARLMKTRQGTAVCYNVQMAVDHKHRLIAASTVSNSASDRGQLAEISKEAKQTLAVEQVDVVTDMGYYDCADVSACEKNGITVYMHKPPLSVKSKQYTKDDFQYNASNDTYRCPAGADLAKTGKGTERGRAIKYYTTPACATCPKKSLCTKAARRRIKRLVDEEVVERMVQRARDNPDKMRARKGMSEHPFGTLKRWMDQGYFLMRGKFKVGTEISMSVMAFNMKRAFKIVGVKDMIAALA